MLWTARYLALAVIIGVVGGLLLAVLPFWLAATIYLVAAAVVMYRNKVTPLPPELMPPRWWTCRRCGTTNRVDATGCVRCGRGQPPLD